MLPFCCRSIIIPPVVINQICFIIFILTTPLNGLGDVAGACYLAEGGVSIGGCNVTAGGIEFADVLGQVPAVGVPRAVNPNGQRAGSDGLGRIPGDEPECRMIAAGEVERGNLEIASVDVMLVERDVSVYRHLLIRSASHAVVGAFHYGVAFRIGEAYRAIFGVVDDLPDTRFRFDAGLVAVCIEERSEGSFLILLNGGVLVERIGSVFCAACHAGAVFDSGGAVANVVVIVLIILAVHLCCRQFGAGIVGESIIHYRAFAGCIASGGASEVVVHILALRHEGGASVVGHSGE